MADSGTQNSAKLRVAKTKRRKFYAGDMPSTDSTFPLHLWLWGLDFEPPPLQISGYATDNNRVKIEKCSENMYHE